MKWLWLLPVLLLASCQTSHPPAAQPSVPAAGSAVATGGNPLPSEPPKPKSGCERDAECPAGQVCGLCGQTGTCMGGCRSDSDCGRDEACQPVQCVRCPCPSQCAAKLGR